MLHATSPSPHNSPEEQERINARRDELREEYAAGFDSPWPDECDSECDDE